jgi:flagellar P-ring protein precursor FlgI
MTPLSLADGTIVGMAQGAVSVGGYDYRVLGSSARRNSVTSGRVPNGLILETNIESTFIDNQKINIVLRDPDFTTASRIAGLVAALPQLNNAAQAIDGATVQVQLPAGLNPGQITALISQIENLTIVSDPTARVVINERTGTIVVGGNVQLLPTVIAHGNLEISIQRQVVVTQPAPFTSYQPQNAETAIIGVDESKLYHYRGFDDCTRMMHLH